MLAGGIRERQYERGIYVDSNGIHLRSAKTSATRCEFAWAINNYSFNASPFRYLRITVTSTGRNNKGPVTAFGSVNTLRTNKEFLGNQLSFTAPYGVDTVTTFDISDRNEHIFINITGYTDAWVWSDGECIIRKIELLN